MHLFRERRISYLMSNCRSICASMSYDSLAIKCMLSCGLAVSCMNSRQNSRYPAGVHNSVPYVMDYLLAYEKFTRWTHMADGCTSIHTLFSCRRISVSSHFSPLTRYFKNYMDLQRSFDSIYSPFWTLIFTKSSVATFVISFPAASI